MLPIFDVIFYMFCIIYIILAYLSPTLLFVVLNSLTFSQGYKAQDMKSWKMHWDRQLYKALEHQYQMGLEALNENLPEIKVELTFR